MTLLLIAALPLPPSVNRRVIISQRGGTLHPKVRKFNEDSENILLSKETTKFNEAIRAARIHGDFISVSMWFYLPLANKPRKTGPYFLCRDIDDMAVLANNVLKDYLGIDDVMFIDIDLHKRLLVPPETTAYVQVSVSSIERESIINEDASIHQASTTPTTANAIHASITQALTRIESVIAPGTSRVEVSDLATSDDA